MSGIELELLPSLLRGLRRRTGRTQVDVAGSAGVPQANLSRWESGRVRPSLESLIAVLNALGMTFRDLQDAFDAASANGGSPNGVILPIDQTDHAYRWLADLDRRVKRLEGLADGASEDGAESAEASAN